MYDGSSTIYQEHSVHIRGKKMSEAVHTCRNGGKKKGDNRSVIRFTRRRVGNSEKTHGPDAHDEERRVFVDARYCIQRLSVSVHPTGDRPWMGE